MIEFKPLTLADQALVQTFTRTSDRMNCDLSFANLFSWRFYYQTEIALHEGFLLLRFFSGERLTYLYPLGKPLTHDIMATLEADAAEQNAPFRLQGVCADTLSYVESLMPEQFTFLEDRDYDDYIYLREDLVNLSGKKYQPKRNHINRFIALYPDYSFEPLTPELVPTCLRLEESWMSANTQKEQAALEDERRSMTEALLHMTELDIQGGVLFVKGEPVAFTYGTPITEQTYDVCVEKADSRFEGVYAMIQQAFAKTIPTQYQYLNREEDLGIEGLRQAKRSYHPHLLLKKFTLTRK